MAHKVTERYMMSLMNLRPEDAKEENGKKIKEAHAEITQGAAEAMVEAVDFGAQKEDPQARQLGEYYRQLGRLLLNYVLEAGDDYRERLIDSFQMAVVKLMKTYELDDMGKRLNKQKVKAIPVVVSGQ